MGFEENRLHGCASTDKDKVVSLISKVFNRIPEDDLFVLTVKRNVQFIMPADATTEVIFVKPKADPKYGMVPVWLISLPPTRAKYPEHEFIYTVAHEMAHVFLEHTGRDESKNAIKESELEADRQVIKWEFEDELKETGHNYIYGDGLKNKGLE